MGGALFLLSLFLITSPRVSAYFVPDIKTESFVSASIIYKTVIVDIEGEEKVVVTCADTVTDLLKEMALSSDEFAYTEGKLYNGQRIALFRVTRMREVTWTSIPYVTEQEYTSDLAHRQRVFVQVGKVGLRGQSIETVTYSNGTVKKRLVAEWIEQEPSNEIVRIGSKYEMQSIEVDGKEVHFWKTLTVVATSYDKNCLGCNETTATGAYLQKGIIAVDPRVIPLHTKMYVPGYGFGQAEDVGGAVKGNKIDLAFEDVHYGDWSKRTVTIYIID